MYTWIQLIRGAREQHKYSWNEDKQLSEWIYISSYFQHISLTTTKINGNKKRTRTHIHAIAARIRHSKCKQGIFYHRTAWRELLHNYVCYNIPFDVVVQVVNSTEKNRNLIELFVHFIKLWFKFFSIVVRLRVTTSRKATKTIHEK